MVSETQASEPSFSAASVASKVRDFLDYDLDAIASNTGRVSGLPSVCRVQEMTEETVLGYLAGLRGLACGLAEFMDERLQEEDATGVLRRHNATYQAIGHDIDGAEGEFLYRRDPSRKAFPGRLRKFNETISRIRQFRVELATVYSDGLRGRDTEGLKLASDFAYKWLIGESSEISRFIAKLEWKGLDEEQRDALKRTQSELAGASAASDRVRNSYGEHLRRQTDRMFERLRTA